MGILNLNNIIKSYGGEILLDDVSLEIFQGDRIALIGRNGTGKTTLFNIIMDKIDYDSGEIYKAPDLSMAYLRQIPPDLSGMIASDVIKTAFDDIKIVEGKLNSAYEKMKHDPGNKALIREYGYLHDRFEFLGGYNTREKYSRIVKGLEIPDRILGSNFSILSGGEKTTVMLAKVLLSGPDILLLDEPTNHLDMDARKWLEEYMDAYRGTIVYTSHDRYFIDRTAGRVVELENNKLTVYKGNFSSYKKEKQEMLDRNLKLFDRQQKELERLRATARQMRDYATEKTIHIAKTIEGRIERMNLIDKPINEDMMHMAVTETAKAGREVLRASGIRKAFGEKVLFNEVDFLIRSGERVAVIGPNGAGKSSFIKILTGEEEPDQGEVRKGRNVRYAYLEQDVVFDNPERTVLEEVCIELDMTMSSARNLLGKFMFRGEDVFKKINILSGGEKSRLRLLLEMREKVNLLILDEPTNHLDIQAREELERAISDFGGTMLFISHDRQFINNFADTIFEIRDSEFTIYKGNYDYYLKNTASKESKTIPVKKTKTQPKRGKQKRKAVFTLRTTESRIEDLEKEIENIQSQIEKNASDYEILAELSETLEKTRTELNEQYEKWMELTDEENS